MATFESYGIKIPKGKTRGEIRTTCPECSQARRKKNEKCLSVNIDDGVWFCHHCNWSGCLEDDAVAHRQPRPIYKPTTPPTFIDPDIFKQSVTATQNHRNHLVTYLKAIFGEDVASQMVADYYIGTSRHWPGSTVFWQIDRHGRVHGGKIMQYNPDNGHRVKEPASRVTWVHTAMKIPDYNLQQCLFGEHLLRQHPGTTIAIVESEKTAIMASSLFGDCITLACGGCSQLTAQKCAPLAGRDVVLFPDNGKFDEWSDKGKELRHLFKRLYIADIMEREAEREGDDIGDLIAVRYHDWANAGAITLDFVSHEL